MEPTLAMKSRVLLMRQTMSYVEIAETLAQEFPDERNIYERIRHWRLPEEVGPVGVIGDTHFPFVHPNYLDFLQETFAKHNAFRVIHIGDLCDNHAISRWPSEPDAMGACQEFEQAREWVDRFAQAFPRVTLVLGNHDRIPERQAASLGMPTQYIKSIRDVWRLPAGWEIAEQVVIDDVMYEHGISWVGKDGALDKAKNSMMSCVIGHAHGHAGCKYMSNAQQLIFGMNVGCGVDIRAYAMRYGKYNKTREVLGCGLVYNSAHADFVPMGAQYFRN